MRIWTRSHQNPWATANASYKIALVTGTNGTNQFPIIWLLPVMDSTEGRIMNFKKSMIDPSAKIYVAGHTGLVGSALVRALQNSGYHNLVLRSHRELNLANQAAVAQFFSQERPEYVFLAAAKVGGILANDTYPADFIQENLAIQNNVIQRAHRTGARRLLFLGSSCIYPKHCPQPIKEEYLLTGPLESTNRAYAVAKIAGIEMCSAYNRDRKSTRLN